MSADSPSFEGYGRRSESVHFSKAVNIEDLRKIARRRLPRAVFDYLDGGAEDEVTLRENCRVFEGLTFRPRQAVAFDECSIQTTVLGKQLSFPVILAPVGYSRLMNPGGEVAAARAASAAGTGYTLSTVSAFKLEDVRAATKQLAWYQLYLIGGREAAEAAIERAKKARFDALVVTIDTPVAGMRERDLRNGVTELLTGSLVSKLPHVPNLLAHPRWLISFLLDGGVPPLANVIEPGKGPMSLIDVRSALMRGAVTWEDFAWIRAAWKGPIVVKGVLIGDDAKRSVDEGAAAIVVSNHGGRQLDCSAATLRALPEVLEAVEGRAEVLVDGGVRRGSDIVKALCLGARAVLIGRAYAYGLAAGGLAGVAKALEILKADFERTLRLIGCPSVENLGASYLYPKPRD